MPAVTSADGTAIAYERTGSGPALVLVDGAMCYRGAGPMRPLAALLQGAFTVYTYDRRGRGESSDTTPYAVAREVEDLRALIAQAGGEAYVHAASSGAALALATAAADPGGVRERTVPSLMEIAKCLDSTGLGARGVHGTRCMNTLSWREDTVHS
jgi:pimeloyl-ACP methyl ester carboxylesterase